MIIKQVSCCIFQIWQSTTCSLLEISVAQILALILTQNSTWVNLGLGVQLAVLSFTRNRAALVVDKLYFWFTLTITFWSDRKQRRPSSPGLIALNFIFFPLLLAIICLAALLAAPLLPLFTLPIFFIGYPRPLRFWPGTPGNSQSTCADTVYYQQVAPQIAQAFHNGFTSGSIGEEFCHLSFMNLFCSVTRDIHLIKRISSTSHEITFILL